MSYIDYDGVVWLNNVRRKDKENCKAWENCEDTDWLKMDHHCIMGDGDIRVVCHKQGLPGIWEFTDSGFNKIVYYYEGDWNIRYNFGSMNFEYNGYKFYFESANDNKPYFARMITPDGDMWTCVYDYYTKIEPFKL